MQCERHYGLLFTRDTLLGCWALYLLVSSGKVDILRMRFEITTGVYYCFFSLCICLQVSTRKEWKLLLFRALFGIQASSE
jgi:hypothetical protein